MVFLVQFIEGLEKADELQKLAQALASDIVKQ
jgi:hypothetical protein